VYNNFPPEALDLINACLKPQLMRPSIDQILQHAFFKSEPTPA
jgi:hypothetical protein